MTERGYQDHFFTRYDIIRDAENSQAKAQKIATILEAYGGAQISDSLCLDLGCSRGITAETLTPMVRGMVGIDYDQTAIHLTPAEARRKILFIHGDAMNLPFANNTFGLLVCAQVYEHVPDDLTLFAEMYRVLKPGGQIYFSGPNWLFPIEPHYHLPFLHWLPEKAADGYLRLLGKGEHFYERSRSFLNLRRVLDKFVIQDVNLHVIRLYGRQSNRGLVRLINRLPDWLLEPLLPLLPNFNWLLTKPDNPPETTAP